MNIRYKSYESIAKNITKDGAKFEISFENNGITHIFTNILKIHKTNRQKTNRQKTKI